MEFIKNIFEYWQPSLINWLTTILQSILILIFGWWIVNKLCAILTIFFQKTISETSVLSFLDSITKSLLRAVLIIIVLAHVGLNVSSLLAAVGASLVTLGISLKENISNLVSGIILVITKPIHVGDYIEFENTTGTVIKIEMLFTTLQSEDRNKTVIIPNARLTANNIVRKSEYDIREITADYELTLSNIKIADLKKYFEKEFILNNKILQIPPPIVEIKHNEDKKIFVTLKIWTQNQYLLQAKNDADKIVSKLLEKYNSDVQF